MPKFAVLDGIRVTSTSEAEYRFEHPLTGEVFASIWFRPMAEENSDYLSERVRLAVERAEKEVAASRSKADRKRNIVSSEQLEEDREMDRVLMARTCATRWGVVPQLEDGTPAEFSEQAVYEFFRQLPNYLFDPCRSFVANVYNFIPRPTLTENQAEALGNS